VSYALVRVGQLDVETFAAAAGMHPELVRRLVTLGVLDATRDSGGGWWLSGSQLAAAGRIQRLRAGFGLNYAATGLVMDLLDQIAALEAAARRSRRTGGDQPWARLA
jgi:chaperone modulatory protein CbpM